jgi:uncharacterized small protein (DUF1192 family)
MLDDDPFAPPPRKPVALDSMSIDELEARIETLNLEIAKCEEVIASKRAQRSAADSLFSGRPSA